MNWPPFVGAAVGVCGLLAGYAAGWLARRVRGPRPPRRLRDAGYKRLTVDLPDRVWSTLHEVAAERSCSVEDSIASAVELDRWVWGMVRDGTRTLELKPLDDSAPPKYLRRDHYRAGSTVRTQSSAEGSR